MKEIKFRIRIKEKDGRITTTYCSLDDFCNDYGLSEKLSISEVVSKDEYIELKDKNGKEIYEGDIVHWYSTKHDNGNLVVEWNDGRYVVLLDGIHENLFQQRMKWFEVIGNIYENPNLI